jgi:hypothetical protein
MYVLIFAASHGDAAPVVMVLRLVPMHRRAGQHRISAARRSSPVLEDHGKPTSRSIRIRDVTLDGSEACFYTWKTSISAESDLPFQRLLWLAGSGKARMAYNRRLVQVKEDTWEFLSLAR